MHFYLSIKNTKIIDSWVLAAHTITSELIFQQPVANQAPHKHAPWLGHFHATQTKHKRLLSVVGNPENNAYLTYWSRRKIPTNKTSSEQFCSHGFIYFVFSDGNLHDWLVRNTCRWRQIFVSPCSCTKISLTVRNQMAKIWHEYSVAYKSRLHLTERLFRTGTERLTNAEYISPL